jgi:hypothetical protein
VDVANVRHHASQLAKQVVVLQTSLVKTQKNNSKAVKMPSSVAAFFYVTEPVLK